MKKNPIATTFGIIGALFIIISMTKIYNANAFYNPTTAANTSISNSTSSPVNVSLATLIAGENLSANYLAVEQDFSYGFINTNNSTTTLKSQAGFIHGITIDTPVASSVITVYDSTTASGTKIAQITEPGTLLSNGPENVILDVLFSTGLTIQQTGATSTVTISYR